jgi:thioredoxin 1
VDECDTTAFRPGPRYLVDESVPGLAAGRERRVEIGDAVADVVNAGTAPSQEPGDGPVGMKRFEELDFRTTEGEGDDAGAIGLDGPAGVEPQDVPIESERVLDALDGDTHMSNGRQVGHKRSTNDGNGAIDGTGVKVTRKDQNRMASANVVNVTDANFAAEIEAAKGVALVDFWAVWCGPCQAIAPVIEQLAEQFRGKVKVAKLDTDTNQNTAVRFNVRSIPTIMIFKDGKHVDTVIGADPRIKTILEGKIQQHLS